MKQVLLILFIVISIGSFGKKKSFPFFKQTIDTECGPSCLKMIANFYDKDIHIEVINELTHLDSIVGTSLLNLSDAATSIGLKNMGVRIDYNQLKNDAPLPCIVHWKRNHFIIVYKLKGDKVYVADPADTLLEYSKAEFCENWFQSETSGDSKGIALLFNL